MSDDAIGVETRARELVSRLDDATRVEDDSEHSEEDDAWEGNVASFRRAIRFAFLAHHVGVRGWEDIETPNPYLAARFEHRANRAAREASVDVLLRVVRETMHDRVAYVSDGPLPRLLGSLSEPDATACATLMLWAEDKAAAATRVSAVEGYRCERAKKHAVMWAKGIAKRDPERRGRFVTTYATSI